ncbi:MAG: serine/threonine-protein kinase [Deinococcota bacterium]
MRATPVIPKRILHYRVDEQLHQSTMSAVYLATDTRRRKQVALKMLLDVDDQDIAAKNRLRLETHIAQTLNHPNIVQTYGLEEADDMLFLVMEYYLGESLALQLSRDSWLELDTALDYALQIARGLAYIHRNRVIHRDIKPTNIFVTQDNAVKILDFGVSRKEGLKGLTLSGGFTGTLAYMPPEQVRGEPVSIQSDLWSFGATFYEMLTGRAPFASRDLGITLSKIQNYQPPPIYNVRPDAPPGLQDIINNLLAKSLDERYKTADILLVDLEHLHDDPRRRFLYSPQTNTPDSADSDLVDSDLPYPDALERPAANNPPSQFTLSGYLPNNLPEPNDRFVGRQSELSVMRQHFESPHHRLMTLLGPKGVGKSRLALEYALEARQQGYFVGGVYWLQALGDIHLIAQSLARAVAAPAAETPSTNASTDPLTTQDYLKVFAKKIADQPTLIVLNDVLQGSLSQTDNDISLHAKFVSALLQSCSKLKIIVTTQTRLNLTREWVLPL